MEKTKKKKGRRCSTVYRNSRDKRTQVPKVGDEEEKPGTGKESSRKHHLSYVMCSCPLALAQPVSPFSVGTSQ